MVEIGVHLPGVVSGALAAIVALALALVVLRAGASSRVNRRLALLLVADAAFSLGAFVSIVFGDPPDTSAWRLLIGAAVILDAVALLLFTGTLESPAGRWLGARAGAIAIALGGALAMALSVVGYARGHSLLGFGNIEGPTWMWLAVASIVALVVSLDAYRRARRESAASQRAGAAALAFVTRDVIVALFVVGWAVSNVRGSVLGQAIAESLGGVSIIVFCSLLTYGILRTQLYDIDLKIRWGIQKGTIVAIIVAAAFVGEKVAENYLSRVYGWVVGSVVAGLLVFAAPRLNKLGDKVASTALPEAQPTPAYLHFKKLEVYKTAVETALETGGIDERERMKLDRLRAKLGVSASDAAAVEGELLPSAA